VNAHRTYPGGRFMNIVARAASLRSIRFPRGWQSFKVLNCDTLIRTVPSPMKAQRSEPGQRPPLHLPKP
jgi:hypothetical protein